MLQGKREEKQGKAGSSLNVLDTLSGPVHRVLALDSWSLLGRLQAAPRFPGPQPGSSVAAGPWGQTQKGQVPRQPRLSSGAP